MKKILVTGAGGFIGGHLVTRLKEEGFWVRGVDIKEHEYKKTDADDFMVKDLRIMENCLLACAGIDECYTLAADMGGAQYVFTGENDASIMYNSAKINLNIAESCVIQRVKKIFYSSSACTYSSFNQEDPDNPKCFEDSAYPANPDSEYGWEKLFSERLFMSYSKNRNLDVCVARFHNIFGPLGSWGNGREKSPAAMCRKVAETPNKGTMEIWGDGHQTRSFLYIDECLNGVRKLMDSGFSGPVNIGSDEMVSINKLVEIVKGIADKPDIKIKHIEGPLGVRGRNSDNRLIKQKLGWAPDYPLIDGLKKTYPWIKEQVDLGKEDCPWSN